MSKPLTGRTWNHSTAALMGLQMPVHMQVLFHHPAHQQTVWLKQSKSTHANKAAYEHQLLRYAELPLRHFECSGAAEAALVAEQVAQASPADPRQLGLCLQHAFTALSSSLAIYSWLVSAAANVPQRSRVLCLCDPFLV